MTQKPEITHKTGHIPKDKITKIYHPRIWRPQKSWIEERSAPSEVPLSMDYNCISHAIMMVSPLDLCDFAVGFSLTEGIIDHLDNIIDLTITQNEKGFIAQVEIETDYFNRLDQFKRVLTGHTGCGLCGIDRLDYAIRPLIPLKSQLSVRAQIIYKSMQNLSELQVYHKETGALHGAAFVSQQGDILCVREDIGRHNALDKLIGHMIREKIDPAQGFALITSRCSFEMVHKCATFGIPILAAVSAATDLAITLAEQSGLSLIAFTRKEGMTICCDPKGRIL